MLFKTRSRRSNESTLACKRKKEEMRGEVRGEEKRGRSMWPVPIHATSSSSSPSCQQARAAFLEESERERERNEKNRTA